MTQAPLSRQLLIDTYASYGRPRHHWRVGGEFERFALDANGAPLPYKGPASIRGLLGEFVRRGWAPYREKATLIAATGPQGSFTLEPGGQLELSGTPHDTVEEARLEAKAFTHALDECLIPRGYRQVAMGYTPMVPLESIQWVPKGRYVVMRAHMPTVGTLGHHMMKGTCATQCSFDFSDAADAARKLRVSIVLAPIVTAMFANSPLTKGRPNGWKSFRGNIWSHTDPARTGFPTAASDFSYEGWVDYLLDVPLLFTHKNNEWQPGHGRSFRQWMDNGLPGLDAPTMADWDLHQTSVFPEVRIKNLIEVRMGDAVGIDLAASFCALFEGLFYDDKALHQGLALAEHFERYGTKDERFHQACRHGLQAVVGGRPLAWWAERMLTAAQGGLERARPTDSHLLAPAMDLVEHGECPADRLLAHLGDDITADKVIELTHPLRVLEHKG